MRKRTQQEWRRQLSVITVRDERVEAKTIFYTGLYHSLLLPWIISDVEGNYIGRDGLIHRTTGKNEYGGFSPWDTFRSLHPLLTLFFPERQRDMVLSMLDVYKRQTDALPTDPMTGNHAVPILVDSWLKGIRGFDPAEAYAAMRKGIDAAPYRPADREVYSRLGYVPLSYPESVTRTVEYAYDDWALGRFAEQVLHAGGEAEKPASGKAAEPASGGSAGGGGVVGVPGDEQRRVEAGMSGADIVTGTCSTRRNCYCCRGIGRGSCDIRGPADIRKEMPGYTLISCHSAQGIW